MFIHITKKPPFPTSGRAVFLHSLQNTIQSLRFAITTLLCYLSVQRGDAHDRRSGSSAEAATA